MNHGLKTVFILLVSGFLDASAVRSAEPVKNIIFMIGDGMGYQQVRAAGMYNGGPLCFESFPYSAQQTTFPVPSNNVTDSAAAATAMATGQKVSNNVVSLRIPGDASRLETILEYAKKRGKKTGLVTTVMITDATPAGFGAHAASRNNAALIAQEYLTASRPNVLLGGGGGMNPTSAVSAGYTVVTNLTELQAINTSATEFLSGQFGTSDFPYEFDGLGTTLPQFSQMTAVALNLLDNDPDGFFLMVEGGLIDHACHSCDIGRMIGEALEFNKAVAVVTNWAAGRTDTLILVTADHETGSLSILADNGAGYAPQVSWGVTNKHSASNVPVYAWGAAGSYANGLIDNTRHFSALAESMLTPASNVTLHINLPDPVSASSSVISGAVYRLESCDSLITGQWTFVMASTAAAPFIVLSDTNIPAGSSRFYRLISIP